MTTEKQIRNAWLILNSNTGTTVNSCRIWGPAQLRKNQWFSITFSSQTVLLITTKQFLGAYHLLHLQVNRGWIQVSFYPNCEQLAVNVMPIGTIFSELTFVMIKLIDLLKHKPPVQRFALTVATIMVRNTRN